MELPRPPRGLMLFLLLAIGILFLIHRAYYFSFTADDTFISLRYAERFAEGKGLTWNDEEYVEGYSNLSWVVLNAGLYKLGFDLVAIVRTLSLACTLVAFGALFYFSRAVRINTPYPLVGALLTMALTAPIAIWANGGMETPLVLALTMWALALSYRFIETPGPRTAAIIGSLLGVLALTRPEGALVTAILVPGLLIVMPQPFSQKFRPLFVMGAVASLFFLAQLAFRLHYYDAWVANTYLARMAYTAARLGNATAYVYGGIVCFLPLLLLLAIIGGNREARSIASQRDKDFFHLLLWFVTLWLLVLIIGGGDYIFPGYRLMMPAIGGLMLLSLMVMKWMFAADTLRRNLLFLSVVLCGYSYTQTTNYLSQDALHWGWVEESKELGKWLRNRYSCRRPLIAAGHVGALGYYSQLPILDYYGLNDRYLTSHRHDIADFGHGMIAHELFDAEYLLRRGPDILFLEMPGMKPACERVDCGTLKKHYIPVKVELPSRTTTMLVKDAQWKTPDPKPCNPD